MKSLIKFSILTFVIILTLVRSHVLLGPFGPTLMGLIDILAEFAADYESDKLVKHVSTFPSLSSSLIYRGKIVPLNRATKSKLSVFGDYF